MNPALAVLAGVTVGGAVLAVSARDSRMATLGVLIVLLGAPLIVDPWPGPLVVLGRVAAALLATRFLAIGLRGVSTTDGSRIGWPSELLIAAAAGVVGFGSHGLGAVGLGPAEAQAAGFALGAIAIGPLVVSRDVLRIGIGALLVLVAASLVRVGLAGPPAEAAGLVESLLTDRHRGRDRGRRRGGRRPRGPGPPGSRVCVAPPPARCPSRVRARCRAPPDRPPRPEPAQPSGSEFGGRLGRRSGGRAGGSRVTVIPFLVIASAAGTLSLLLRSRRAWSTLLAAAGLVAMAVAALAMGPAASVEIGGVLLASSDWLRLYAVLGCVVGLLLIAIDSAAIHEPDVPGVIVLGLGSAVLALSLADPGAAIAAATAGGLVGVLVAAPVRTPLRAAPVGIREVRAVAIAGGLAIVAVGWLGRPIGDLGAVPAVVRPRLPRVRCRRRDPLRSDPLPHLGRARRGCGTRRRPAPAARLACQRRSPRSP